MIIKRKKQLVQYLYQNSTAVILHTDNLNYLTVDGIFYELISNSVVRYMKRYFGVAIVSSKEEVLTQITKYSLQK